MWGEYLLFLVDTEQTGGSSFYHFFALSRPDNEKDNNERKLKYGNEKEKRVCGTKGTTSLRGDAGGGPVDEF